MTEDDGSSAAAESRSETETGRSIFERWMSQTQAGRVALAQPLTREELAEHREQLQWCVSQMVPEVHHAIVPGSRRRTLLKPGAEMLALVFGLVGSYRKVRHDLPNGHVEWEVECRMRLVGNELLRGAGLGSASSMEPFFRYRGPRNSRVEHPDIYDVHNSVLKLARKRAFTDGVQTVLACSDLFEDGPDPERRPQPKRVEGKPPQQAAGSSWPAGSAAGLPPGQKPSPERVDAMNRCAAAMRAAGMSWRELQQVWRQKLEHELPPVLSQLNDEDLTKITTWLQQEAKA